MSAIIDPKIAEIKHYLRIIRKMTSDRQKGYYNYVLLHGRAFTKTIPCGQLVPKGKAKQCYHNAGLAVIGRPQLKYYEGWAHNTLFPMGHAWLVYQGKVIDPTWENLHKEETAYFGLHIPSDVLLKYMMKFKISGPFLGRYLTDKGKI